MVMVVVVAVSGLFAFLRYTRIGMRIRAGTLDLDTVSALGVNVAALRSYNFAVGSFSPVSRGCWRPVRSASIRTWATI
jgi:branched-chain amino acid transport system permease protein